MARVWIERREAGWRVRWIEGGARQSLACETRALAERARRVVAERLTLTGSGHPPPPRPAVPLLSVRLDAWITACRPRLSPRTVDNYADAAAMLCAYLGVATRTAPERVDVTALTREALGGFHAWLLEGGRAPTTAAKRLSAIRLAWAWLAEGPDGEWMARVPSASPVRRPPPEPPRSPTWAECARCVAECAHLPWLHRFAVLAYYTGLRRAELVRLRWADVELEAASLVIPASITKGGRGGRRVPMSPHLVAALRTWPRGATIVQAPPVEIRAAETDGRGHVDRLLRRAWMRAGVDPSRWAGQPAHAFHKALETECTARGGVWTDIECVVGHRRPGTGGASYVDAELTQGPLRAVVALIEPLPEPPPPGNAIPFPGSRSVEAPHQRPRRANRDGAREKKRGPTAGNS